MMNIFFGEGGTTTFLRRLRPIRQQPSFQLGIKMQIIQTSEYVKVRVERILIHSEIRLKSLCTVIVLGQLCWLGMVWGYAEAVQGNLSMVFFLSCVKRLAGYTQCFLTPRTVIPQMTEK